MPRCALQSNMNYLLFIAPLVAATAPQALLAQRCCQSYAKLSLVGA